MTQPIRAIIPIAGLGTRLRPHTYCLPKVLLMTAGKPVLGHILDRIKSLGIEEVVFIVGHLGNMVEDYVGKNYNFKTHFIEQKELKGLGHAISLSGDIVKNGPVFIVLGDTIIDADFSNAIKRSENFIGVKEVADPRRFGVVKLDGDYASELIEKPENPPSNLAIAGVYYIQKSEILYESLTDVIKLGRTTKGEIQLTDALEIMIEKNQKIRVEKIDGWFDCGTINTLLSTNVTLLEKIGHSVPNRKGVSIKQPVFIAESADIKDSIIGPYVSIGENVVVKDSVISNSIIHPNSVIRNATIFDSILGYNSFVDGVSAKLNISNDSEVRV